MDEKEKNEREQPEEKKGNAMTRLYDKLPFTFRQVDIFVKIMIGVILALVVYGIIKGSA